MGIIRFDIKKIEMDKFVLETILIYLLVYFSNNKNCQSQKTFSKVCI